MESARVIDVDLSTFTVTVTTKYSNSVYSNISYAMPYIHHYNGEGIHFVPEVGSLCVICFLGDESRPFVMCWIPVNDEGNFRARRSDLNPGDIYLGTRDENALILRRGGVVQIGSTALSQRFYLPIGNIIRDICENYFLQSLGGDLSWEVERGETTTDGERPSFFRVRARHRASDKLPIAELRMGSHYDGSAFSLLVRGSGTSYAVKSDIRIDKSGNLSIDMDGSVRWEVGGNVDMNVDGNIQVSADGYISITSVGTAQVRGQAVSIEGATGVRVRGGSGDVYVDGATTHIDPTGNVTIGGGAAPVALFPALMAWLNSHTHEVAIPPLAVVNATPLAPGPVATTPFATPSSPPVIPATPANGQSVKTFSD